MNHEIVDSIRVKEMERRLGCIFCEDGTFAEMSLHLADYREQTSPIADVEFRLYRGDMDVIREMVAEVDDEWVRYVHEDTDVFCGFADGRPVSFCLIDTEADCILSRPGLQVGSIGCVGTVPAYRKRGIGLRMVDLATVMLQEAGCQVSYISYTHIDHWYERLGYRTFARFSFL